MQQQLQLVANQINALAQGSVRPSQDIVQRLTYDLFRVFVFARLTQDQQLVLSVVVNQVANSANLTPAQVQDSINTGQVVLQSSGAPLAIVHPVTCDLHAVAFELQPNLVQ
jgi:hypothetical protein